MEGRTTSLRLTVRERILLHLLDSTGETRGQVPVEATQPGIAAATGIERRHVPEYVRPMIRRGLVTEEKAWVRGRRQRVKTYRLTDLGRRRASQLRSRVLTWTVEAEGLDGTKAPRRLAELFEGPHRGERLLRILETAGSLGFVPLHATADAREARSSEPFAPTHPASGALPDSGTVTMVGEAPEVQRFVGRERELRKLTSSDPSPRMFIIEGIPGIGKSCLAAEVCHRLRGTRSLFWHHVRPWDSRQSILLHLAEFLAAGGRPDLRAAIVRSHAERVPAVLAQDLLGTRSLLVFDDAHQASAEASHVFQMLLEAMRAAPDVRTILTTRRRLGFYDRRDVTLAGDIGEIGLEGLEAPEVLAALAQEPGPWTTFPVAPESLRHPLLLELCRANRALPAKARTDVTRFLLETLLADLSPAERGMMELASLYEVPVPADALLRHSGWDENHILALAGRLLLRVTSAERYEIHDTIREFFRQRLSPRERRVLSAFATKKLQELATIAVATRQFRSAADSLSNAVRISDSPPARAALEEFLGDVQLRAGDLWGLSVAYRSGLRDTRGTADRRRLHRKLAAAFAEHGMLDSALAEVKVGRSIRGSADRLEEGWFELVCARVANRRDLSPKAEAHASRALSAFRKTRNLEGTARASLELAYALSIPGKVDAHGHPLADRFYDDALRLASSVEDPRFTIRVHMELAGLRGQVSGDKEAVLRHLSAVESLPETSDDPFIRHQLFAIRAWTRLVLLADFPAAEADAREAIRLAQLLQDPVAATEEKVTLSGAVRGQGRLDEAGVLYDEIATDMLRLGYDRDRWLLFLLYVGEYQLSRADREGWKRVLRTVKAAGIPRLSRYPHGAVIKAFDAILIGHFATATRLFDHALLKLRESATEHGLYAPMKESGIEFWYAVALAAMGQEEQARVHRNRAMDTFRARHYLSRIVLGPVRERDMLRGIARLMEARDLRTMIETP